MLSCGPSPFRLDCLVPNCDAAGSVETDVGGGGRDCCGTLSYPPGSLKESVAISVVDIPEV